jgi:drug/metabolite transporter (DMT)-like permease
MAGTRFTIAGAVLFGITMATGGPRPTRAHWRNAAIVGAALMCFGNGILGWTEQFIPSGFAAIVVAIVPFWMVILDWLRPGGQRPGRAVFVGLALGTIGLVVLVGPIALDAIRGETAMNRGIPFAPVGALMVSSFVWAAGSIYSRYADMPSSAVRATAMEMFCGGILLLVLGALAGEPRALDISRVSARSLAGLLYLITLGSFVGFTAYVWLLKVVPPPKVATHAYVNPVVAVLLGSTIGGETLTVRTLIAAAIIVIAVALITTARARGNAGGQVVSARVRAPLSILFECQNIWSGSSRSPSRE